MISRDLSVGSGLLNEVLHEGVDGLEGFSNVVVVICQRGWKGSVDGLVERFLNDVEFGESFAVPQGVHFFVAVQVHNGCDEGVNISVCGVVAGVTDTIVKAFPKARVESALTVAKLCLDTPNSGKLVETVVGFGFRAVAACEKLFVDTFFLPQIGKSLCERSAQPVPIKDVVEVEGFPMRACEVYLGPHNCGSDTGGTDCGKRVEPRGTDLALLHAYVTALRRDAGLEGSYLVFDMCSDT